jgi:hypothetical protein
MKETANHSPKAKVMVKLQNRIAKKRYLNSKRIYRYRRVSLDVPRRFHEAITSFFNFDLEMKLMVQDRKIFITLECPENKT